MKVFNRSFVVLANNAPTFSNAHSAMLRPSKFKS